MLTTFSRSAGNATTRFMLEEKSRMKLRGPGVPLDNRWLGETGYVSESTIAIGPTHKTFSATGGHRSVCDGTKDTPIIIRVLLHPDRRQHNTGIGLADPRTLASLIDRLDA